MRTVLLAVLTAGLAVAPAAAEEFLGKKHSAWLNDLSSKSASMRRSAAFALGKLGSTSGRTVKELARALADDKGAVRDAAAFALGEVAATSEKNGAEVWEQAGQRLLTLLKDEHSAVRRSAAFALGSCGGAARTAISPLMAVLGNTKNPPVVRRNAAWALGSIGKNGRADAIVESLIAALERDGEDALVLRDVAGALGQIGAPGARPAIKPLAAAVKRITDKPGSDRSSNDTVVRKTALATLVNLVDPALAKASPGTHKVLVEVLGAALKDGDAITKGTVAGALANLGEHVGPALRELAALVEDNSVSAATRRNAVLALAKAPEAIRKLPEKESRAIVEKLGRVLETDQSAEVRRYTAEALSHIGFPLIEAAVASLVKVIGKDPEGDVRHKAIVCFYAARDLESIKGAKAALTAVLKDNRHVMARYAAARALAYTLRDRTPLEAVTVLEEMLNNKSVRVYLQTNANVQGGSESSGGQTSVKVALGGDGRFMAAHALGYIGPKAGRPSILRVLDEMTRSKDTRIKKYAEDALSKIKR